MTALVVHSSSASPTLHSARTSMNWKQDSAGRIYALTHGTWHATISHSSTGEWLAIVGHEQKVVAYDRFTLLQEAKAWCEEQLRIDSAG